MFPSVGAARRRGTAVLIEDVAFPVDRLADAVDRPAGALRAARLRRGDHLRPRQGRQPALRPHAVVQRRRGDRPVRAPHGRRRRARGEPLRRGAEGRARDRAATWPRSSRPSGAPRPTRSCGELKRLVDPDGILNPGVIITDDPRAHLAHLKSLPGRRRRGGQVHRVRLLRAEVPEPRPDADAAAAHRRPPADGAPERRTGRRRQPRAPRSRLRLRGARHLRGRRPLRHRLPGRHRHRAAHQAPAERRVTGRSGTESRGWVAAHFAPVERAVRLALGAGGLARRSLGDRRPDGVTAVPGPPAAPAAPPLAGARCRARHPGAGRSPTARGAAPSTSRRVCRGRWAPCPASRGTCR